MGTRLDPARRQPTGLSRAAGLLLQVALAVLLVVRIAETEPVAEAVVVAVPFVALFVAIWWSTGRWFSLVLLVEVVPVPIGFVARALGVDGRLDVLLGVVIALPAALVGLMAGRMDRNLSAPIIAVGPGALSLAQAVVTDLRAAGFAAEPDLTFGFGLAGQREVVAVFAHGQDPAWAEVLVDPRAKGRAPSIGLTSFLGGRGALETQTQGVLPIGPARLRQVFPGAGISELMRHHRDALAWLQTQGVPALPVDRATYPALVDHTLDDTAESVRAHPLRSAARALLLMARRRQLDKGPLQEHPDVKARVGVVLGRHQ